MVHPSETTLTLSFQGIQMSVTGTNSATYHHTCGLFDYSLDQSYDSAQELTLTPEMPLGNGGLGEIHVSDFVYLGTYTITLYCFNLNPGFVGSNNYVFTEEFTI